MNSMESLLSIHDVPFLSIEQDNRIRFSTVDLAKINEIGASHYGNNNLILSVVEWCDGFELPVKAIRYLNRLNEVTNSNAKTLSLSGTDWRIFTALGLYVPDDSLSISMPSDGISDMILIAVLSHRSDNLNQDEQIESNCRVILALSNMLEIAFENMGIRIE